MQPIGLKSGLWLTLVMRQDIERRIMDSETWKFINTFAPWFSAIGTISAVIVSLYLARAEKPMKLEIRAGHRIIVGDGSTGKYPEFLYISATNTGHRIATITNVGWRIGFFKKQHMIQVVQKDQLSSGLPVRIDDGEEAKWLVPLDLKDNWIERFTRDFLHRSPRLKLCSLKLQIHTSVGKTFEAAVEKSLKEKLLEECRKQKKHGKSA